MITIAIFATVSGFAQDKPTCSGLTKKGEPCKLVVWKESALCWRHNPNYIKDMVAQSTICTATTATGLSCKMKTRHESGICFHHRPKTD